MVVFYPDPDIETQARAEMSFSGFIPLLKLQHPCALSNQANYMYIVWKKGITFFVEHEVIVMQISTYIFIRVTAIISTSCKKTCTLFANAKAD